VQPGGYAQSVITQLPWDERDTQTISQQAVTQRAQENLAVRNRSLGTASDRGTASSEMGHVRNGSVPSAQYQPSGQYPPQSASYGSSTQYPQAQYSGMDYQESAQQVPVRRHDYDVQAMEASLSSPRPAVVNPIPAPTVTVKSEFPTLNRSRQQQSLTCLVTIEVPLANHRDTPMDMGLVPPFPSGAASDHSGMRSPTGIRSPVPPSYTPQLQETPEELERITEELHHRVENWHGLDFSR
jgi:hypothetical protein